jgi:hypothetical protein
MTDRHFLCRPSGLFPFRIKSYNSNLNRNLPLCLDGRAALSQGLCIHRTIEAHNKMWQASVHLGRFEPTIHVYKRKKTFYALYRAAVFGEGQLGTIKFVVTTS